MWRLTISCAIQAAKMGVQALLNISCYPVGEMESKAAGVDPARLNSYQPCMTFIDRGTRQSE